MREFVRFNGVQLIGVTTNSYFLQFPNNKVCWIFKKDTEIKPGTSLTSPVENLDIDIRRSICRSYGLLE